MQKDLLNENRGRFKFMIIFTVAVALICLIVNSVFTFEGSVSDANAAALLDTITYTEDAAETEMRELKAMASRRWLSTGARGLIYQAMAGISYMSGDDMEYNLYVSSAIFYLENAGMVESVAAIYNKYIGRLYANGCYDSALEVLDQMAAKYDISALSNDFQASYYLSRVDVCSMLGVQSDDDIQSARRAIAALDDSNENKRLHMAKLDMLTVRQYINGGEFDAAQAIMDNYTEHQDLGLADNNVYVICDYRIAYLEMQAKLYLHNQQWNDAYSSIDAYLDYCDSYNFRMMKLNLLRYVVSSTPYDVPDYMRKYRDLENTTLAQNLNEMTSEYGQFLLDSIADNINTLAAEDDSRRALRIRTIEWIIAGYLLAMVACGFTMLMNYMNHDGLTKLNDRKTYEHARIVCEKKHLPYYLLMLDIDDFKKINDTFGHEAGDNVLRSISATLLRYTSRSITAYRYGGEEMCMIFHHCTEAQVRQICEDIRMFVQNDISNAHMHVTVSGGVGISAHGENVFQVADKCLYYAKETGKNRICWQIPGSGINDIIA